MGHPIRDFPKMAPLPVRHVVGCWVTLLHGVSAGRPCGSDGAARLAPAEASASLPHPALPRSEPSPGGRVWATSPCSLSHTYWREWNLWMQCILRSQFKSDSCVSLVHPKVTHFSLRNLTCHHGAVTAFPSLLCPFVGRRSSTTTCGASPRCL